MKKYLMISLVAIAFASCSNNDLYDSNRSKVQDTYDAAFRNYVGVSINPNQDWGFGTAASAPAFDFTRSQSAPEVRDITAPYDANWVANYLATAKEPNSTNVADDYDNGTTFQWANIVYYGIENDADYNWFVEYCQQAVYQNWGYYSKFGLEDTSWDKVLAWLYPQIIARGHADWISSVTTDETYVRNFKITGTWDGDIRVAADEGLDDNGNETHAERTVVVTGTWNLTEDQRIGSLGKVIVANGGTINISEDKTLSMVNQSRLVVLSGGKITGAGNIAVTNGNADGFENYNAGTIDITGTFNNNFGKFFNYGTVKVANYASGGSGEGVMTNGYFNHGLTVVNNAEANICRNARIYNACQFYVKGDMQLYILEEIHGAAFIVDGELRCNTGNDGSNDPSYVSLEAGALVECGTLYNNLTSWTGPTSNGYAVVHAGQITYLNWAASGSTLTAGYFINNIYMCLDDATNDPDGNGNHVNNDEENYPYRAGWKFEHILANGLNGGTTVLGNGNTKLVEKGTDEAIPADEEFVKGVSGCTPGFKIKEDDDDDDDDDDIPETFDVRIIAEDLSATEATDFDFNDVVFDVTYDKEVEGKATITLRAAGGTLPLRVAGKEVHKEFGDYPVTTMINTHAQKYATNGYGAADNVPAVSFDVTGLDKTKRGNDILVEVQKTNDNGQPEWYEITAKQGEPAAKIAVDPKFEWCLEKVSLKSKYTNFTKWVENPDFVWY